MDEIDLDDQQTICLSIDMGSYGQQALEILIKLVMDVLQMYEVTVNKIELG